MTVERLVERVREFLPSDRVGIVGIAGAVAVGKTAVAAALAEQLRDHGRTVAVVSTDAFLLTNEVLKSRGLIMRKGFPETYDTDALIAFISDARAGRRSAIPVYSHDIYDVTDARETVDPADVVIVEGVIALQDRIAAELDCRIYVEADEQDIRSWFVDRFERLTDAGRDDGSSFYHGFASLTGEQVRELAEATWDGINGINLRDHIAPSKLNSQLVVRKGADHSIVDVG